MDEKVFTEAIDKIVEKVGEEQSAIIADDLGNLRSAQKDAMDKKAEYEKKIEELTLTNSQLIASNANLLRKIPINEENKEVPNSTSNVKQTEYNPFEAFDEFGRLKK